MKIIKIRMIYDWKDINAENDNIDVFVETDDGYNYTLSLATGKIIQFLMDKEEMDYYGPGYPFIIVNKLTPKIIEQAVKDFAEGEEFAEKVEEEGSGDWLKAFIEEAFVDEEFVQNEKNWAYWLKVYHFGGWQGLSMRVYLMNSKRNISKNKKKYGVMNLPI